MITITKRFKFYTHLYSSLLTALVSFHDQLSQVITKNGSQFFDDILERRFNP